MQQRLKSVKSPNPSSHLGDPTPPADEPHDYVTIHRNSGVVVQHHTTQRRDDEPDDTDTQRTLFEDADIVAEK